MVLNWVFGIALNTANALAGLSGLLLAYFGITASDEINVPQGMDNDGVIGLSVLVLGFFGVAAAGLALIGVVVLNFGYKSHKVFLGFPYCFVTLALIFMGVAGFVLEDHAEKTLRRMYDECCVEYEDCCVKDPDSLKNMDDLHRRYNCCAFDGPSYFVNLNKVNFPKSCCPQDEGVDEVSFRCSAENAYKAACKTKIYAELNPYVITLEAYCFTTSFFCGVVTALIVVMASMNIYMNKN